MVNSMAAKNLSKEQENMICQIARSSVIAYIEEQEARRQRSKEDLVYNTRILLENYRKLKEYQEKAAASLEEMKKAGYSDVTLTLLETFGMLDPGAKTQLIAKETAKTNLLIAHIDRMLEVFRDDCLSSPKATVRRQWQVIKMMYIDNPRKTVAEIAEELSLDQRVIQQDAQKAREELTVLFFGIGGIFHNLVS